MWARSEAQEQGGASRRSGAAGPTPGCVEPPQGFLQQGRVGAGGEKRPSQEGPGGFTLASPDSFITYWAFALSGDTELAHQYWLAHQHWKAASHFWGMRDHEMSPGLVSLWPYVLDFGKRLTV